MLDVAPTELLLVAVVAVVVIGPKDLPKAMRFAGYWVGRARGVARQFRSGFDEMMRESELAEMEKKWADENARIMREFPSGTSEPAALTAPAAETDAPVMTETPVILDQDVVVQQSEGVVDPAAPAGPVSPPPPRARRVKSLT